MQNLIIGIDSGANGGIAIICEGYEALAPKNAQEIVEALENAKYFGIENNLRVVAFLEALTGWQKGRQKMSGRQAFVMGKFYGMIIGALVALKIEFRTVAPQEWQKVHADCKDKDYKKHKHLLYEKAKRTYPKTKITLKTADAVLIAEYGEGVIENEAIVSPSIEGLCPYGDSLSAHTPIPTKERIS